MNKTAICLLLASSVVALPALAGPTVDLSVEASRPAANDLLQASIYSEASGANPAELARKVNQEIGEALKTIRARAGVSVKSGQQSTYPVYGQGRRIESWRMRSELILESRDQGTMSELVGQLQQMRLALGELSQMPSPETRRKVEEEAMRAALDAFRQRAAVVAEQLGKRWTIKHLSVQQGGGMPVPMFKMARGAMLADATPAPVEAGESQVTTSISGQIELSD